MSASRAVLITGVNSLSATTSGTGRATALRLHRAGWPVYASGRSLEGMKDLAEQGIRTLRVDMADEGSMVEAVERISAEHGAVGVLVNNAAYSLNGTVGETPMAAVRDQFETNFFGLTRMTQLVLPGMREQRSGRIVLMSSIFGLFGTAGRGYYQATKHAVEALGDSLRQEVRPWNIRVSIVEPSPILGSFVPTTVGDLGLAADGGMYADFWERFVRWHAVYREVEKPRGRGRTAVRATDIAAVIERAVSAERPRTRYRVGLPVRVLARLRVLLGDRAWEWFLGRFFPQP